MYKKTDFNVRFPFFPMIAIFPAYVTLSTCLFDLLLQFIKDRRAEERAESHVQPSQSFLIRLIVTSLRRPSSMLKTVEGVTPERYASSLGRMRTKKRPQEYTHLRFLNYCVIMCL